MLQRFRWIFSFLLLVAGLALAPRAAFAAGATGRIVGTVTDPAGSPVPGATVTLTNEGTNEVRKDNSDADGNFTFPAIATGNYSIRVETQAFRVMCSMASCSTSIRTCPYAQHSP